MLQLLLSHQPDGTVNDLPCVDEQHEPYIEPEPPGNKLKQMVTKRVWTPVDQTRMTQQERAAVIRSSMFVKEKFQTNGQFDKLKARLVAGGHMQGKELYENLSAPTAPTCGVFTVLAIAAKEKQRTAVIDIGGAFLHADMNTGVTVHMRLIPRLKLKSKCRKNHT